MANVPVPDEILNDIWMSNSAGPRVYLDKYGRYEILIESCQYKQVKVSNTDVHRVMINRIKVLASEPIEVTEPATVQSPEAKVVREEPYPPGYRCNFNLDWDGEAGMSAGGNAKAFVEGIFGEKMDEKAFKATFVDLVGDEQPARGLVIQAEVRPKSVSWVKDRKMGDHCIKLPLWQCLGVPGTGKNTREEVARRKAEIDQYIVAEIKQDAEREQKFAAGAGSSILPASGNGAPTLPASPPPLANGGDPLAGWQMHPDPRNQNDPDPVYWKGSALKRKSELLAGR